MTTHTPGPWTISDRGTLTVRTENQRHRICYTEPADFCRAELEANARLIASAPDMAERIKALEAQRDELLEKLEELVEVADLRGDSDLPHPADDPKTWTARMQTAWDEARDAIAKARGE